MNENKILGLGCRPDLPDQRDYLASGFLDFGGKPQEAVSLRDGFLPPRDQGNKNSCTGFALTSFREYLETLDKYSLIKNRYVTEGYLSPLFVYNWERKMESTFDYDEGATLRSGLKVLRKYGVAKEGSFEYNDSNFYKLYESNEETRLNRVFKFMRVDKNLIKSCLSLGFPIVCGVSLYTTFYKVGGDGVVQDPNRQTSLLGGHAMVIVGYDENYVELRNSWGENWGYSGYCFITWDYFYNNVFDLWTAVLWK